MLARRIIPCLDVAGGRVVKGTNFVDLRDAGDPVALAARYDREGADELVLLDIDATREGRSTLLAVIDRIARSVSIPFTVGGGIRNVEDIRAVLGAGADKVSLNSSIVREPDLLSRGADRIGAQSLVAAIDVKRSADGWKVWIAGGRTPTGLDAVAWARECVERGAGELLLTSMDRDGTREGYDIELLRNVASVVSVPVIASGGAGNAEHLFDGLTSGGVDAVLVAGMLHDGSMSIGMLKHYLHDRGIPIRV